MEGRGSTSHHFVFRIVARRPPRLCESERGREPPSVRAPLARLQALDWSALSPFLPVPHSFPIIDSKSLGREGLCSPPSRSPAPSGSGQSDGGLSDGGEGIYKPPFCFSLRCAAPAPPMRERERARTPICPGPLGPSSGPGLGPFYLNKKKKRKGGQIAAERAGCPPRPDAEPRKEK